MDCKFYNSPHLSFILIDHGLPVKSARFKSQILKIIFMTSHDLHTGQFIHLPPLTKGKEKKNAIMLSLEGGGRFLKSA